MSSEDEKYLAELNRVLAGAELGHAAASIDLESLPILYVVGSPRSGTTLLSQVLVAGLDLGYISNLGARFWSRPSVGLRLTHIMSRYQEPPTFTSRFGAASGVLGPHEFGYFWTKWLGLEDMDSHCPSAEILSRLDVDSFREHLYSEVLEECGKPVLFRNIICGFFVSYLVTVHANSVFIYIERDSGDTCRSILNARMEQTGGFENWWSLKPASYSEMPHDPVEQVYRQVRDSRTAMRKNLGEDGVKAIRLCYRDLIDDPNGAIEKVCDDVHSLTGYSMEPTGSIEVPEQRSQIDLPRDMVDKLDALILRDEN